MGSRIEAGRNEAIALQGGRRAGWLAWIILVGGVLTALPSWGQGAATPEIIRPPSGSATIPPGNDGALGTPPRTEQPQVDGGGTRPIPDAGVIAPPATGAGSVIRPPAAGVMPVIPPPGSPGGAPGIVPK